MAEQATERKGWTGVDLDGTLARYDGWHGMDHIGDPVPLMVERVQAKLAAGEDVRIMTARVCSKQKQSDTDIALRTITHWAFKHIGQQLPITSEKDFFMRNLLDDRCEEIVRNTGISMRDHLAAEYGTRIQVLSLALERAVNAIAGSAASTELRGVAEELTSLLNEEKLKWKQ